MVVCYEYPSHDLLVTNVPKLQVNYYDTSDKSHVCDVLQYIPRNMHTVFALLCFVVVIHWLIFPYPSGLLHWHCGNLTIAPVPAKQPWWIWINTSCEFIMNDCITTTKQSTTKPCAYFLGYTVYGGYQTSTIRRSPLHHNYLTFILRLNCQYTWNNQTKLGDQLKVSDTFVAIQYHSHNDDKLTKCILLVWLHEIHCRFVGIRIRLSHVAVKRVLNSSLLVLHICNSELCQYWFRWWLGTKPSS